MPLVFKNDWKIVWRSALILALMSESNAYAMPFGDISKNASSSDFFRETALDTSLESENVLTSVGESTLCQDCVPKPVPRKFAPENLKKKISPLPFDLIKFMRVCDPIIPRIKGVPQTTSICAPEFHPYVATVNDNNKIAKAVGHHYYIRGNPKYNQDYDDPVAHGLHPLYMVLPPLKDVFLVRVQDSEGNGEDRDVFSGAYLTIKNGIVIDQINEGCNMNLDYTCADSHGNVLFRVLDNGKFERLQEP